MQYKLYSRGRMIRWNSSLLPYEPLGSYLIGAEGGGGGFFFKGFFWDVLGNHRILYLEYLACFCISVYYLVEFYKGA